MAADRPRVGGAGDRRSRWRAFANRARLVAGIVWAAAPLSALLMAVLTVAGGVAPTVSVWLQRAVLNGLIPRTVTGDRAGPAGRGIRAATALAGSGGGRAAAGNPLPHGVNSGHVALLALTLAGVGLISAALPHGRRYVEAELCRGMGLIIQDRTFRAVSAFPGISRFESPAFYDKIRLVRQLGNNTAGRLVSSVMTCGQSVITAVGLFATLEVISPVLAAIVAGTAVPAITAQVTNSRKHAELEWRKSPAVRRQMFYGRLLSDQEAAKEVRLFGLADFLRGRMMGELRSINRGQRALDRRIFSIEGALSLLRACITGGGLLWVVRQATAGKLSVGDVTMFAMAVVGVQTAIASLTARIADMHESLLMFGHYADIISAGPDLPLAEPPLPLPALSEGIEVRDVWFRYDSDHPWVLRGVSMTIPHGRSAALIGLNGAGKSTLVKLLCRMYDPQRGRITWDGVDVRNLAPAELRRRIGTVFQDYMTYDLTATENIGMGDLDHLGDADRIRGAAEQAGVHDKVEALPRGYQTLLSRIFFDSADRDNPETGVILSGGQWQRLALARGLMRADRDLLILDEPSSGLDAEAEHAIHKRLADLRRGRTSLLISHRLGSVRGADVIYVLSAGVIAEQGTHRELMATGGEYRRLFTLQANGYQEEDQGGFDQSGPAGRAPARNGFTRHATRMMRK